MPGGGAEGTDEPPGIFLVNASSECFQKAAVCLGDPISEAGTLGVVRESPRGDAMALLGDRGGWPTGRCMVDGLSSLGRGTPNPASPPLSR